MNKIIFFLVMIIIVRDGMAQGSFTSDSKKVFQLFAPQTYDDFFIKNAEVLSLSAGTEMQELQCNTSSKMTIHKKYKQTYKGIDVFGGYYFLHGNDRMVDYGTGTLFSDVNAELVPIIGEKACINAAISFVRSEIKNNHILKHLPELFVENLGMVIIDNLFPKMSGQYSLAYRKVISTSLQNIKYEVIISAIDGSILFAQNLVHHHQVEGIGKTFYYGNQKIITDSIAPDKYVLRDLSRGEGNTTYTMKNGVSIEMLTDSDNIWDNEIVNDKVAIDAHYCTAKFYDLMFDSLDYYGLDGKGKSMNPVIHVDGLDNFVNAFWNGEHAFFGHGDCHNGPLTTLSVVAHEFTHGVTQYNSNLIYNSESGAINESISDIFGKSSEYFFDRTNFSWELGKEFSLSQFSTIFRSFEDPNKFEHTKVYKGNYWEDNADVHVNSSVLNHWFYLLVSGNSNAFKKVELMDVLKVVFLCQTSYLTPTSDYPEMYEFSLLACSELFGNESYQYKSMVEAWKLVGLPYQTPSTPIKDLSVSSSSPLAFLSTCVSNDFYPIKFNVKNVGNTIFEKSEILQFKITTIDSEIKYVTLNNDILPGQVEEIVIDDVVFLSGRDYTYVNVALENMDNTNSNNEFFLFLENYIDQAPNIEISSSSVNAPKCFSDAKTFDFYITNISCNPISKGELFELLIYTNDQIVIRKEVVLEKDLFPGEETRFYFESNVQLDDLSYAVLKFEKDVDPGDNIVDLGYQSRPVISQPVSYDFETDEFDRYFSTSYALTPYYYKAESYLSSTGYIGNMAPCPDLNSNFVDGLYSTFPVASACLDLTAFSKPSLSLDMLQFRSDYFDYLNDKAFSDQTSMMQIEYSNDGQYFSKEYFGFEEGKLTHQELLLPEGFKGELKLKFYNYDGDGYISNSNIGRIDAILIDNVSIDNLSSTQYLKYNTLKITPNPANQLINLNYEPAGVSKIELSNAQGIIMKVIYTDTNQLDIVDLTQGLYFIKISCQNGITYTGKFVKM